MAYSLMMTSGFLMMMQMIVVFVPSARAQAPNSPTTSFRGQGGTQSGLVQPQPGALPQAGSLPQAGNLPQTGTQAIPPTQSNTSAINSEALRGSDLSRGVTSETNTTSPTGVNTTTGPNQVGQAIAPNGIQPAPTGR